MMLIMIIINNNKSLDRMEVDIAILVSDFSYSRGLNILATFLLQKKKKRPIKKMSQDFTLSPFWFESHSTATSGKEETCFTG